MRKRILLAGGGILLLGAGSILLISRLDSDPVSVAGSPAVQPIPAVQPVPAVPRGAVFPPPQSGAPSAPVQAAPGVLVPEAAPLAAAPVDREQMRAAAQRRGPGARPVAAAGPALELPLADMPPAPDPATWATVPIVSPFGAGTPAPAVTRELGRLRPELQACFRADTRARYQRLGAAFSRAPEAPPPGPAIGPAILLLEVESDGQVMQVLDGPVETRGSVSDATLSCAQAVLRGARLAVPSQGQARFRMRYSLKP